MAENFLKETNHNFTTKEEKTYYLSYRSDGCQFNVISSVLILTSKDFDESLVVTTL